jgi:hypothetical protein
MEPTLPNPRFALTPPEGLSSQLSLVIGTGQAESNFTLHDEAKGLFCGLYSVELNPPLRKPALMKMIENSGWALPSSALVSVWDHRFCLVPQSLFDASHAEALFQTACGAPADDEIILFNTLKNPEAVLLFSIQKDLKQETDATFQKTAYFHVMQPLLRDLSDLPETESAHKILIHIRSGRFDMLIAENGKPVFLNSFPYQSPEDVVYFCLFSMETLGLKAEKVPVHISGQVERQSMVYRQLHKYVRNLNSIARTRHAAFSQELDVLPRHFFNALFQLPFCE